MITMKLTLQLRFLFLKIFFNIPFLKISFFFLQMVTFNKQNQRTWNKGLKVIHLNSIPPSMHTLIPHPFFPHISSLPALFLSLCIYNGWLSFLEYTSLLGWQTNSFCLLKHILWFNNTFRADMWFILKL